VLDTKVCGKCREEKPVSEFYKRPDSKCGYKSDCKICYNFAVSERSKAKPELNRARAMRYYDKHLRKPKATPKQYELLSETEKAYFAGIFDGEGHVRLGFASRTNARFDTVLSIVNTDLDMLLVANRAFGGSISMRPQYKNRKIVGHLQVSGEESTRMAEILEPYSRIKKKQLKIFIEARRHLQLTNSDGTGRKGIKLTTNEILTRREYVERLKSLR